MSAPHDSRIPAQTRQRAIASSPNAPHHHHPHRAHRGRPRFIRRTRLVGAARESVHDEDPLAGIANLFDVSVAFIVALLIALFSLFSAGSMLDPASSVTIVKQSAKGETEIITKKGAEISVQKVTDRSLSGEGVRLGTAYRLANGQVVYVPEGEAPPQ
jgi:hypothetical protein